MWLESPFCFGEYGVQVADSFSNGGKPTQNVVTCLYRAQLAGIAHMVAVNWCKTLVGQGLSVNVEDSGYPSYCKVDMKPWLFWKKKGSKTLEVEQGMVEVFWDLSAAKYGAGPEPTEGYFLAVVSHHEIVLLLGDMGQEAYKRILAKPPAAETLLISRREHIFGKRLYSTKARFTEHGQPHDIVIECNGREPRLCVRVDKQLVVQVRRLLWKFRGNQTIIIDGLPVELFWDVHSWFFNPSHGHAVFMFQTCIASNNSTSAFQWHQASSTPAVKEDGFSLVLYAWKSD